MKSSSLPVSEFKAKCLRLLDEVESEGKELVITKRGQPIAKVVPINRQSSSSLRGLWQGHVKIKGDIVHFSTADEWESNA